MAVPRSVAQKVERLRREIREHEYRYYVLDQPTISDRQFDRLMDEQRERARAARKEEAIAPEIRLAPGTSSRFVGYRDYESESEILAVGGKDGHVLQMFAAASVLSSLVLSVTVLNEGLITKALVGGGLVVAALVALTL